MVNMAAHSTRSDSDSLADLIRRQRPGFTLEQAFYRDPEIFRRDMEKIVARSWFYVAHVSEIPNTGDYLLYNIGDESIIVLRDRGNEIRAFFNVCRHRGSHICLEESGNVSKLTCPYHAWVYNLDGRLLAARGMPQEFDKSRYALHNCAVRVSHGLIFLCLTDPEDETVPDFSELSDELDEFVTLQRLEDTKLVHREVYPTYANWKLAVENFRECYHCSPAHPAYTRVNAYVEAFDKPGDAYQPVVEAWARKTRACGHPTGKRFDPSTSDPRQPRSVWRQPIRDGFQTLSEDGQPVGPLLGDLKHWDGGETGLFMGPLSYAYVCSDHLSMFRFTPMAPEHCEVVVTWHVHKDAVEGVDYDIPRLKWMWDVTTIEDTRIIIDNQRGVNSTRYVPGPYAPHERGPANFTRWYLDRLMS